MKVFTAFSGYDSQCMALDRLHSNFNKFNYELVGWSEIDKYAIQAHNVIYPQYKDRNYGDISKINWDKVDDFDLLTYSSPCFIGDTLVLTINGYKNISDITNNDIVITHLNEYKNVAKPMKREYRGDMFCINSMCSININCTPEHPFYVREMFRKGHHSIRCFKKPVFKFAKDLSKKDYLGIAIDTRSELPKWNGIEDNRWGHHKNKNKLSSLFENKSFWYLMGRYIGDGWKKKGNCGNGIIICSCDKKIDSLLNSIKDCGFSYNIQSERTVNKVQISSNELFKFVERYGYYAYGKRIDGETIGLPKNILKYFIKGYIESDGCCINGLYKITSTSKELVYGIGQCVSKVYNVPFKIYFTKRKPTCKIEGRIVNQRDTWQICWKIEKCKQDKAFFENGYIWFPIRNINKYYSECIVYNMEVEDNHTYTANGVIVHNCQDFSCAGNQKGGEKGSGTRSSLLWECERAIKSKRPKYLLMENVSALVSSKFIKLFNKWQTTLESYGYTNYAKILNAKDFEIPQNRERIFMVSVRNDVKDKFYFPQPFKSNIRLKDILEDKVDEKYYIDNSSKDKRLINIIINKNKELNNGNFKFIDTYNQSIKDLSVCIKTNINTSNLYYISEPRVNIAGNINPSGNGMNGNVFDSNGLSPTLTTNKGEDNKILEFKGKLIRDGDGLYLNTSDKFYMGPLKGISRTIKSEKHDAGVCVNFRIRKLTPKECFRLMDVSEININKLMDSGISNSQLYKLAGNSIVVNCLYHIFRKLFVEKQNEDIQTELF